MREVIPLCLEGTDFTSLHLFHDLDGFLFYPSERRAYMEMQVRERERVRERSLYSIHIPVACSEICTLKT